MEQNDIFQALREERNYQLRRWGVRQPDQTMAEQPHSVAEFVIFMRDYYNTAAHAFARAPSWRESLIALRKLVALAMACVEQGDSYNGRSISDDDLFETIRLTGRLVPVRFHGTKIQTDFGTYMLKINQELSDAEVKLAAMNPDAALVIVKDIILIGVECFKMYGVPYRDWHGNLTNMRDGLPA